MILNQEFSQEPLPGVANSVPRCGYGWVGDGLGTNARFPLGLLRKDGGGSQPSSVLICVGSMA